MSMQLLEYPEGASREVLETTSLGASQVLNLNGYARMCGPYRLRDWARPRGIELYYVDNCWVRAAVTGQQAGEFISDVLRGEPDLANAIEPDKLYLLESEEF